MRTTLCRRQFVARSLAVAGAALLLPTHRLGAIGNSNETAATEQLASDSAHQAVLGFVASYGEITAVSSSSGTTSITATITCPVTMGRALTGAGVHGIRKIRAAGNVTRFELGGQRFEIVNRYNVA